MTMGLFGLALSLLLLMALAYRGISVIVLAPLLAMLAVLLAGDQPLLATYTQIFMIHMGTFVVRYFPIFLLGAIFGKLMEDSGSAKAIAHAIARRVGARHAILVTVLSCGILTYGGVSVFVVVFAVYPLAVTMFCEASVPKRLLPAAIALGSATFSMTCLPGTMQIHNILPAPVFGTDLFAAPALGIAAGFAMFLSGMIYLNRRARIARAAGEGYGDHHLNEPLETRSQALPHLALALTPIVIVLASSLIFSKLIIPSWETSYLAETKYGAVKINEVSGLWSMISALLVANLACAALHFRSWADLNRSISAGATGAMLPTLNTASEVGYGSTIASLAAFALIKNSVMNVVPGNPMVSAVIAINVLAGVTGSASGGLSIALSAMGQDFVQLAQASGISPAVMHRLSAMACGGLDSLPHNGAVITLLTICGLSHRQSYRDIGVVTLIIPVLVTTAAVLILSGL